MSKHMSKLLEYLDTNNYEMAITAYNDRPEALSEAYSVELARAFFANGKYENTSEICQKLKKSNDSSIYFDSNILLIKSKFLSGLKVSQIIQDLQFNISRVSDRFPQSCLDTIRQIKQCVELEFNLPASSMSRPQLRQFGKQFNNLYEKESLDNPLTDCMPMFLISTAWFKKFQEFVGICQSTNPGGNPGPITHFQILDHRYSLVHDATPQKIYTNYLIFPGAPVTVLPRSCWQMLRSKFKGFQLKRFNVWVSGKPREIMTEIYLKKIKMRRGDQRMVYEVQVTKKETWGGLIKKMKSIWKNRQFATILELVNGTYQQVPENTFLEQVNTQDKIYLFSEPTPSKLPNTAASINNILSRCQSCGKTNDLKFCQCKTVKYCDAKCQKEDREKHRKKCETQVAHLNQKSAVLENFNLPEKAYSGRRGLVGLRNLGNTCYMNSGLQCMINTKELTDFFMKNQFIKDINYSNPLGTKGNLACAYAQLVREMWTGSDSVISPFNLKKIIGKFAGQFSGYGQQDSQEFISYLIDGLQEDLNLVKKKETFETPDDIVADEIASKRSEQNYAKRIKSYIRDLMAGQFKSTVVCQKCDRVSICFDPSLLLTLPIPSLKQGQVFYVSMDCSKSTKKISFTLDSSNKVGDLRRQLHNHLKTQSGTILILSLINLDDFSMLSEDIKDHVSMTQILNKVVTSNILLLAYDVLEPRRNQETYEVVYLYNDVKKSFSRYLNVSRDTTNEEISSVLAQSIIRYLPSKAQRDYSIYDLIQTPVRTKDKKILIRMKKIVDMLVCSSQNRILRLQSQGRRVNLYDCLTNFTNTQSLDGHNKWYCNKCKDHVRATKKMQIYKSNKILVLAFKRFSRGFKIKDLIQFPIEGFNIGPYVKSNLGNADILYDLYGVVNHYGTMSGGHYTAYCRNFITGDWYEFDDSRVSRIGPKECISQAAYVLFYRLRDR